LPVGLSSVAAAFSIVAEKQQRTLEPILATPIKDSEFLLGKMLAAVVPGIGLTWVSAIIAVVIVDVIGWQKYGVILLPDAFWLIGILLIAPLLGVASVLAAMRLSARMTDPQSANQLTALVIMPIFMLSVGIFGKVLTLSISAALGAGVVLLLVAVILFRWNIKKFQREEILTRWK
jgi:ABC-2 type transport system permease protein